jgi:hypothetical protein
LGRLSSKSTALEKKGALLKYPLSKSPGTSSLGQAFQDADSFKQNWIQNLIHIGVRGHYPLFEAQWLKQYFENQKLKAKKLTAKDRKQIMRLKSLLAEHREIEHKKEFVQSLNTIDRDLLIFHFMMLVETKTIDLNPHLH